MKWCGTTEESINRCSWICSSSLGLEIPRLQPSHLGPVVGYSARTSIFPPKLPRFLYSFCKSSPASVPPAPFSIRRRRAFRWAGTCCPLLYDYAPTHFCPRRAPIFLFLRHAIPMDRSSQSPWFNLPNLRLLGPHHLIAVEQTERVERLLEL